MAAVRDVHRKVRKRFDLPVESPKTAGGISCGICTNRCRMAEGEVGYCGLRGCEEGRLVNYAGTPEKGLVEWYYDPLPTNCVAGWACAASGCGYPTYSYRKGHERGYKNLAVFYRACSFDCLFCQNWHYREKGTRPSVFSSVELADAVTSDTACVCYFGGDPTPQLEHALRASEIALENNRGRILRICWETNGSMNEALLKRMIKLSMETGGSLKFDLKAWNENLHIALTGVSNERTLANFKLAASLTSRRSKPPPLVASTLLIPAYIDVDEVAGIASFISSLDEDIPYSLLAFHPDFCMQDLPTTTRSQAEACLAAAYGAGLKNVHLGNIHLL